MKGNAVRDVLGNVTACAAQFCFACVLFLSPLAYRTLFAARPAGSIYEGYTDFFVYPYDYFLGACLALGAFALLVQRRAPRFGPWYMTAPLTALLALCWLGVATGIDSTLVTYQALRLTLFFGLYLFLVNFRPAPLWVVAPLALGVVGESVIAVAQFQTQTSVGLFAWGELRLNPQLDGTSIVRDGALRILRAYGLTDHPNLLGGFFTFALILILGYYFVAAHTRARYLLLVPIALGSAALILTFSRAATLATLAGVCFLGACWLAAHATRAVRWRQAVPMISVMVFALLLPTVTQWNLVAQRSGVDIANRKNSGELRSLVERDVLIASAGRILLQRPILGVGIGALPLAMYRLDPEFDTKYFYQPVHIVIFEIATELGVFGAAAWAWLTLSALAAFYKRRAALQQNAWTAAIAATLLAFTLLGLFDYYPWLLPPGRIWQWTLFGLAAVCFEKDSA